MGKDEYVLIASTFFNLLRLSFIFSFLLVPLLFFFLLSRSLFLFSASTSSQFILSFFQLLAFSKKIACSSSLHTFFLILLYSHFLFPPFCKKIVLPSLLLPSFLPPVFLSRITRPSLVSRSLFPSLPATSIKRHSSSYLIISLLSSFIYRPFSFRNIPSHLSAATPVGDSFCSFLSLSLSPFRGTRSIRAL